METLLLKNEEKTRVVGAELAEVLVAATHAHGRAMVVFIRGELGAGKSTLVRSLLRHMGVTGVIPSPTYSLVESYHVQQMTVSHMDAYRLIDAAELEYLGIDDAFSQLGAVLVEWPDHVAASLPAPDVQIHLAHVSERPDERVMTVIANQRLSAAIETRVNG